MNNKRCAKDASTFLMCAHKTKHDSYKWNEGEMKKKNIMWTSSRRDARELDSATTAATTTGHKSAQRRKQKSRCELNLINDEWWYTFIFDFILFSSQNERERERDAWSAGVREKSIDSSDNRKRDLQPNTRKVSEKYLNKFIRSKLGHTFFGTQASTHHRLFRIIINFSRALGGTLTCWDRWCVNSVAADRTKCAMQTKGRRRMMMMQHKGIFVVAKRKH